MTCERYREPIQELADGTLGPIRRAELQTHLDTCDACRTLAADLQKIRRAAESLDAVPPPDHVWLQIAGRLRQDGRVVDVPQARTRHYALLAVAAALVLAVAGALYLVVPADTPPATATVGTAPAPQGSPTPGTEGNARTGDPVQSVADDLRTSEQHLLSAIAKLEAAATADPDVVAPEIAENVRQGNNAINEAIAASAEALKDDPESSAARSSYFQALRQKVTLLQNTIVLMNEMRKGNSAAAALLVDSEKKS
jgi:hypothetical protein